MYSQENCWFKGVCSLNQCDNPLCVRFEHMLSMFKKSNLKETQWGKYDFEPIREDIFAYEELDKIKKEELKKWYNSFHSLYLWSSNYLNGKTTWAIKLLQNYLVLWVDYQFSDYPCAYFITANQIKEVYKGQVNDPDRFNQVTFDMANAELLIIDDIDLILGDIKLETFIAGILDERYKANKSIIYTSHLSPEDFTKRTINNKFLESRVIGLSNFIEFKAPSYKKEV